MEKGGCMLFNFGNTNTAIKGFVPFTITMMIRIMFILSAISPESTSLLIKNSPSMNLRKPVA